jgi:hypothetical protein
VAARNVGKVLRSAAWRRAVERESHENVCRYRGLVDRWQQDFDRVMRLIFDAASILRHDLELGEDAIGKTLIELADWATN